MIQLLALLIRCSVRLDLFNREAEKRKLTTPELIITALTDSKELMKEAICFSDSKYEQALQICTRYLVEEGIVISEVSDEILINLMVQTSTEFYQQIKQLSLK